MDLAYAILQRPVVLDGGLATLLEAHGHDLRSDQWSARLLTDDPDAIRRAHLEFFAAGAEVATTASYQAPPGATDDLRRSVRLAQQARDEHGAGWVAASVGPYGAILADGSEYRGDYGLSIARLRDFHRPRLETLCQAGADVLAVETIPCLAEVEAVLALLDGGGVPAWISLTTGDGVTTRFGEPLREAYEMAAEVAEVIAVGVNCLAPEHVPAALAQAAVSGKPLVAYPNSGQGWDAQARDWTGTSVFESADVAAWEQAGARLIGGCCRVGPADIASVAARVGGVSERPDSDRRGAR